LVKYLYRVAVAPGLEYECVGDAALELRRDDRVIVRCDRYQDYARVAACQADEPVDAAELERQRAQEARGRHVEGQHLPEVMRRATPEDDARAAENDEKSRSLHGKARERIAAHRLEMKLIHTHCSFDRRLAVFQFSAEGRVDFRELLRDLSGECHMRVELRQVGVRDEAAIQGGLGSCGRAFCCCTFLKRFNSINVKMAKVQGLSLNPANISGVCGRLKCCLEYEVEHYRELYEAAKAKAKQATATAAAGGDRGDAALAEADNGGSEGTVSGPDEESGEAGEEGARVVSSPTAPGEAGGAGRSVAEGSGPPEATGSARG
jgi:cell fate regulator YaaT (PSP1 superfamily)